MFHYKICLMNTHKSQISLFLEENSIRLQFFQSKVCTLDLFQDRMNTLKYTTVPYRFVLLDLFNGTLQQKKLLQQNEVLLHKYTYGSLF